MKKLRSLTVGGLGTNCYLLCSEDKGLCTIVDPGAEAGRIIRTIEEMGLRPENILLTHGHFDHILAVKELREHYKELPVWASSREAEVLEDPMKNLSARFGEPVSVIADCFTDSCENAGGFWNSSFFLKGIPSPGHTCGSMCYYCEEERFLLSGDTIFAESVGRTDFPTGSSRELAESVGKLLGTLPEAAAILPGHGPETTVGHEKRFNPYYMDGNIQKL